MYNNEQIMTISGVNCYEENGTAYLNLEAVARGLGFTRTAESGNEVVRWDRVKQYLHDVGFVPTSGHGFSQEVAKDTYIPENVFYRLAMKAKNEAAEKFQALVADEIIPSIRKTGGYIAGQEELTDTELLAKAVLVANKQIEERNKRIESLEQKVALDAPKVLFADAVATSHTSILIGEFAKLLKQNGIDIGRDRLFAWLRENGWLIKDRRRSEFNSPSQKGMNLGLFDVKEGTVINPDGSVRITRTTKVTGKGQQYFINLFLNGGQTA